MAKRLSKMQQSIVDYMNRHDGKLSMISVTDHRDTPFMNWERRDIRSYLRRMVESGVIVADSRLRGAPYYFTLSEEYRNLNK